MESDTSVEIATIQADIFEKIRTLRKKMLKNGDGGLEEDEIEDISSQISQAVAGSYMTTYRPYDMALNPLVPAAPNLHILRLEPAFSNHKF